MDSYNFHKEIRSADLDGKNEKFIVSLDQVYFVRPFDITIYGNILYWSDTRNDVIDRVNKATNQNLPSTYGHLGEVREVAMFHSSRQPQGELLTASETV